MEVTKEWTMYSEAERDSDIHTGSNEASPQYGAISARFKVHNDPTEGKVRLVQPSPWSGGGNAFFVIGYDKTLSIARKPRASAII